MTPRCMGKDHKGYGTRPVVVGLLGAAYLLGLYCGVAAEQLDFGTKI